MDEVRPGGESLEPSTGQLVSLFVAVETDQVQLREAFQHGFGVSAHAQCAVDDDSAAPSRDACFDTRRQETDAPLK
ncbi:hypothetical protein GCM10023166_17950 [Paeniglutamicibacter cryotolerans]